jgi:hypothetical protein
LGTVSLRIAERIIEERPEDFPPSRTSERRIIRGNQDYVRKWPMHCWGAWAMEPDTRTKARIVALSEEMEAIHHANCLYWKQGNGQTLAAKVGYRLRNERLERIRLSLSNFVKLNSKHPADVKIPRTLPLNKKARTQKLPVVP